MDDWTEVRIGDVTENFDSKRIPVRSRDRRPGPYPYYGASGIVDWVDGYLFDGLYLLVAEDGENVRARNTPIAFLADGKFWVNNHAHVIRGNERADTRFLAYAIEGTDISGFVTGSAQPKLSQSSMNAIRLLHPPLSEQRAIASVLGSLDDKIELNRRMNRTLEQMAAAIFKAWFVDFAPVRAKASGAASFPGMPQPVFDALPATFADSDLGPIPEGWEVKSLDEIADYLNGLALQKYPPDDGPTLPRLKIAQLRKGDTEGAELSNSRMPEKYIVHDGDVIFSWSGSLLVKIWTGGDAALNQHLFKVTSDHYPKWFYYLWTTHHLEDFQRTASSKATTMGHIKRHHLEDAKVVVPLISAAGIFDLMTDTIQPLLDLTISNGLESRSLAETRDALLPKLLSGEVRVSSANDPDGSEWTTPSVAQLLAISRLADELDASPTPTWLGAMKVGEKQFVMPILDNGPAIARFEQQAYAIGLVVPEFDWGSWRHAHDYADDPNRVEGADLRTIQKLATFFLRAERFYEGTLAHVHSTGTLAAMCRRLGALAQEIDA